jgi:hypothetical protein
MIRFLYLKSYLLGYEQWIAPRWLRKTLCGTDCHRAWLTGSVGAYLESDIKQKVCDRKWSTNRKTNRQK